MVRIFCGISRKNRAYSAFLHEEVGAVSSQVSNFVGEIHITTLFECLDLVFRCNFVEQFLEFFMFQKFVLDALHFAMQADDRLRT